MSEEADPLRVVDREPFAYVTTVGRRSGRPHRIEIWFARGGRTLYLLSGGGDRADWVANLRATPRVRVEVGPVDTEATARVVTDDDERAQARRLVFDKYQRQYAGDLTRWRERSLPVAIDLPEEAAS